MWGLIPTDNKEDFKMSKLFRRITATAMASALALSAFTTCANAAIEVKTFKTRHVNSTSYVPSEVNYPAEVRLKASADKYTGVVTSMTELANGTLTITSSSHTIIPEDSSNEDEEIVFSRADKTLSWTIDLNSSREVVYKAKANTTVYGTLEVEGKISR